MDIANPTNRVPTRVSFSFSNAASARALSVLLVASPELFDALGHPQVGGLYDPRMGPIDKNARCGTCGLGFFGCPGHFGRVELPVVVYYPPLFGVMFQILRNTCHTCCHFRNGAVKTALFMVKLRVLRDAEGAAALLAIDELDSMLESQQSSEDGAAVDTQSLVRNLYKHAKGIVAKHPKPPNEIQGDFELATTNQSFTEPKKSGLVQQARRRIVMEFLKRSGPFSSSSTQCQNCKVHIPSLHRHANTKIFQLPSRKGKTIVDAPNMIASNVEPITRDDEDDVLLSESSTEDESKEDDEGEKTRKQRKQTLLESTPLHHANTGMKYLTPLHVQELLAKLWNNERDTLTLMFGSQSPSLSEQVVTHNMFFIEVLSVPPCRFRPPAVFGDQQFDHPQNSYLAEIIRLSHFIVELQKSGAKEDDFGKLVQSWLSLQEQVNYFCDSSRAPAGTGGRLAPAGIKQILEKKEGLFRKHMMGKRVNYAARSVISPDPNIGTGEIGVPLVFARKLTYPEPVTSFNKDRLKEAVIRGPTEHPGATHVQMGDGSLNCLENMSKEARAAMASRLFTQTTTPNASCVKVHRHIMDGDVVLMNRQPTLHKPSMMTHRVRVLQNEKTLRMHYANCNTYNADFDGDEMNLHFHQNEQARAEAYTIASTSQQYLVPTDGAPLRGLIQDHIVTGVLLCLKDTWLTREDYMQLLFGCLPDGTDQRIIGIDSQASGRKPLGNAMIQQLKPAILKPRRLWSGKQLISTVLLNLGCPLTLTAKGKVRDLWGPSHVNESHLVIQEGIVMTGVLDKNQLGAAEDGLTHAIYEFYGPEAAATFLTTMARLLTKFDQMIGFTCRMDDLLLKPHADKARRTKFQQAEWLGKQVATNYTAAENDDELRQGMEQILRHDELLRGLDSAMKGAMNKVTSEVIGTCLPDGQLRPFPYNNMALMTQTGAKGSMVNFSQISGCLGQQELEGRRVPTMVSGKTLPSFPAWDTRARAGGYISQRFLSGIRPQEFFFHCMAGREGLIDTAVKTSRSGYLQRCLIKHLESLRIAYDGTVRDNADQSIVQFAYGEDGLDVAKQKCLTKFSMAASNVQAVISQCKPNEALERVDTELAHKWAKKALKHPERYPPVMSTHNPNLCLGSCSERFLRELEEFLESAKKDPSAISVSSKQFRALMWLKYMRALVEPGEAVGLLAAQSIGEPSTQMTLNTFHFAGFGAKNVTLGIPRLREIIMTASQRIKTPMMSIKLLALDQESLSQLADSLSKVTMENVLTLVTVSESLILTNYTRTRVYTVGLEFDTSVIDATAIKKTLENQFVAALIQAIDKKGNGPSKADKAAMDLMTVVHEERKGATNEANDEDESAMKKTKKKDFADDDDDGEAGDMDASEAKAASRRKQHASYEDDEDEKEAEENANIPSNEPASKPISLSFAEGSKMSDYAQGIKNYRWNGNSATFELHFPTGQARVLLLDLIERIAPYVVIRQIPGISSASVVEIDGEPGKYAVQTDGVNFQAIWEHASALNGSSALIDHTSIHSNDIGAILRHYGVEAARASIVREIASVFAVYGISVDARHLSLIADYMTSGGSYRPFNRQGMETSTSSPLLKMTFETTVGYLINSAVLGDWDELRSPAARIVMGLPVQLGTGSVEIRQAVSL